MKFSARLFATIVLVSFSIGNKYYSQNEFKIIINNPNYKDAITSYSKLSDSVLRLNVVDGSGNPVKNLTKNDVQIMENGWEDEVLKVVPLSHAVGTKIIVNLLLDNSNSMDVYSEDLIKILDTLVSSFSPSTKFRIITFNEKSMLFKDVGALKVAERMFNKNDNSVKEYYKKCYSQANLSVRTYLKDQLYMAFKQSKNDPFPAEDKFYILLSDGEDNASDVSIKEALSQYKSGKVYIIDFNLDRPQNPFLEDVVATPLHAEYYKAKNAAQLASYFKSVGEKIVFSGYEVTFEPNIPPAFVNTNVFEFKNNQFLNLERLKIEEVKAKELFPLLNFIFFDDNSSVIPDRYKLLDKEDALKFDEQKLLPEQMNVYHNLLNIVGSRMKGTESELTLYGCNSDDGSEKNNLFLSKDRAVSVKDYLTNIWGIDPARIKVLARNLPEKYSTKSNADGKIENRRVEMFSNDPKVLDLIELNHRTYLVNPNALQIKPHLQSKRKIVRWTITIKQGKNDLYVKNSSDALPELFSLNLLQNLDFTKLSTSDLMVELSAVDERGNKAIPYSKRIPVDLITSSTSYDTV